MRLIRNLAFAIPALLIAASTIAAQGVTVKEEKPGLLKKAKITAEAATATAQAKFPKATLKSAELEQEDGKLIYSFDFETAGKSGIDEVAVDAMTGKVLSVEHETPKSEAAEKAKDKKKEKDDTGKNEDAPKAKTPAPAPAKKP